MWIGDGACKNIGTGVGVEKGDGTEEEASVGAGIISGAEKAEVGVEDGFGVGQRNGASYDLLRKMRKSSRMFSLPRLWGIWSCKSTGTHYSNFRVGFHPEEAS